MNEPQASNNLHCVNDRDEAMCKRHSFTHCIRCVQSNKHSTKYTQTHTSAHSHTDRWLAHKCLHYTFVRRILWFIGKQQATTINSITKKRTKHHKTGVHVYVCVCVWVFVDACVYECTRTFRPCSCVHCYSFNVCADDATPVRFFLLCLAS